IEIVSMPENLYFNAGEPMKYFDQLSGPFIDNQTALENVYRLNMGGGQVTPTQDTGMYRNWDQDNEYIYGGATGLMPVNKTPITYTMETPDYTAPELVYGTQRSMGPQADSYNLTWILPVDSGFYYMLRLHFCSIIPQYTKRGQTVFKIFINKQTAEEEADLFYWTEGSGYAVFRDYAVLVNDPDGQKSKQDLWLELHPNSKSEKYRDGFLNGLEVFKMSSDRNLAGPNPELSSTTPQTPLAKRNEKKTPYAAIIGGIGGGLFLLSILVFIVLRRRRRVKHYGTADDRSSYGPAYSESKSTKSY
ncbi:receptor-like protein kinase FERONIA, partial [Tanacetum coccineum]